MTRFDADVPAERQKLFAEAVLAHRERASAFLAITDSNFTSGENISIQAP